MDHSHIKLVENANIKVLNYLTFQYLSLKLAIPIKNYRIKIVI